MTQEEIDRRASGWGVDPDEARRFMRKRRATFWSTLLLFALVGAALTYAGSLIGRGSAQRASETDLRQSFENGFLVGTLCAKHPELAACRPEELKRGGVL